MIQSDLVINNTPCEEYILPSGRSVFVKREDLSCPLPGPQFSKIRGVLMHLKGRSEKTIGVLDTFHSKAGWAVSYICKALGKRCVNYFPVYKNEEENGSVKIRVAQENSLGFGAELIPLKAGRSAILYHQAKKQLASYPDSYLMPNALKLQESVTETAEELGRTDLVGVRHIIVPSSSATIAAGVLRGLGGSGGKYPQLWVHLGYTRSLGSVKAYLEKASRVSAEGVTIIDEGYQYKDCVNIKTPFPCNPYYDAKSWKWLSANQSLLKGRILFWNIGS